MKKFIISVLGAALFFAGLGALVEKAGASFKSDEKALALIKKARLAIGGDSSIGGVQSMRITGFTTQNIKVDGIEQTQRGETEINLQLPDKLMKMIKIGNGDETAGGHKIVDKRVDVVVVGNDKAHQKVIVNGEGNGDGVKKILIKKADGTTEELSGADAHRVMVRKADGDNKTWTDTDGKTVNVEDKHVFVRQAGDHHSAMRHNELLRLTLGLLLTAPQGMDVNYTFAGEGMVDGTACNIVIAEFGGSSFKIYLGQSSNLPVMMSYSGVKIPAMMRFTKEMAPPADGTKDVMVFRKTEGPAAERAEFNVKFSDYRTVGGIQLPFKWTQTVGGVTDETFEVSNYEINPANIGEKFQHQKVMVRTKKAEVQ
jgi:hypothetical protein